MGRIAVAAQSNRLQRLIRGILTASFLVLSTMRVLRALDGGSLFPNDFGPAAIDTSKYPKEMQSAYHLFLAKCSTCHTVARPINSQFLELSPEEIAKARKETPEYFKDPKLLQPEEDLWKRYVKRMMTKPGCQVKGNDGERIWKFLVHDAKVRKTGANWPNWRAQRARLLDDFKTRHPDDFKRLFGTL